MAHLVKVQTVKYTDAGGRVVPKGTAGAARVVVVSKKWYGAGVPGMGKRRVPLATDKTAARRMLDRLVQQAERGGAGVPSIDGKVARLDELVAEFGESVGRKATARHTANVVRDVRRVLAGCKLAVVADLCRPDIAVAVEKFVWSLVDAGTSPANAHRIGRQARQFTRWLWRKKKVLDADPLAALDLPKSENDGGRRRALTETELAKLYDAVKASNTTLRHLTPADRLALYAVAVTTGFRVGELSALTAAHFDLTASPPTVTLPGEFTKNGKDARLPLSPAVVPLVAAQADRHPSGPLWPGKWGERAGLMIRKDLTAAGVSANGGKLDFHCLRHTFTTFLGRTAPLKVVQELARHSTPILTVGRYSHAEFAEKATAVAGIPTPDGAPTDPAAVRDFAAALGLCLFALLFAPPA